MERYRKPISMDFPSYSLDKFSIFCYTITNGGCRGEKVTGFAFSGKITAAHNERQDKLCIPLV